MKKIKFTYSNFILIVSILLFFSCGKKENIAPTCSLTSPANGVDIAQGDIINIVADANDTDGDINEVKFYVDGIGLGSANSFPYSFDWNTDNVATGSHIIKASAEDNEGEIVSAEITINIIGTLTDFDGNIYNYVTIGEQDWMAENLKTTHYSDGTAIPLVSDNSDWANLSDNNTDDAYCFYSTQYGALYTWAAAMGDNAVSSLSNPSGVQGVCPTGWHLPSDLEWNELIEFVANDHYGNEAYALSTVEGWNAGSDDYDFGALPCGYRTDDNGWFSLQEDFTNWWTSWEYNNTTAWSKVIYTNESQVFSESNNKSSGLSVRCVKD